MYSRETQICNTSRDEKTDLVSLLEKILFTAKAAASLDKAARSAPTNPGVRLAMRLKSKEPSKRSFLERTDNMRALAPSSGIPDTHRIKNLTQAHIT